MDFFHVKPHIYWTDFFVSATIAHLAASTYLTVPLFSLAQFIAFPIAVFWLYRVGSLVHEVAHLSHHEMRLFKLVWNLVVGVVTFTPSPFYTFHHRDHHSQRTYGSSHDPEYVANIFRPGNWRGLFGYLALILVFPVLVFLRFLLAPLTLLHPKLRNWVLVHASSLTLNLSYERTLNTADRKTIGAMEALCWLRATLIPAVVVLGFAPWTRLPQLYLLGVSILLLNSLRQIADHHFESNGRKLSFSEHILDSCNYSGKDPLTWLFFPFSIRFHALHHLFPVLPYHNLEAADAHLLKVLPADSPYRRLNQPGWWSVARKMIFPNKLEQVAPEQSVAVSIH